MADKRSDRRPAEDGPASERTAAERRLDHAAIERLAGDLLPALVAKLADTGLGEIEVREGSWRVRVRRPAGDIAGRGRRTNDRAARAQPGHAGHGHPSAGFEGHRSAKDQRDPRDSRAAAANDTNGATPVGLIPVGPGADAADTMPEAEFDSSRAVATSPAVGVYQPRADARPGSRVRAGDRVGTVDMLGVPQEVVAPIDGTVGASLAEPGQAVEYGQELVVIEPAVEGGSAGGGQRPGREA